MKDLEDACIWCEQLQQRGSDRIIITRGDKGCILKDDSSDVCLSPAFIVDAVDATGAGDCFNGALAADLAEGKTLLEATRLRWRPPLCRSPGEERSPHFQPGKRSNSSSPAIPSGRNWPSDSHRNSVMKIGWTFSNTIPERCTEAGSVGNVADETPTSAALRMLPASVVISHRPHVLIRPSASPDNRRPTRLDGSFLF